MPKDVRSIVSKFSLAINCASNKFKLLQRESLRTRRNRRRLHSSLNGDIRFCKTAIDKSPDKGHDNKGCRIISQSIVELNKTYGYSESSGEICLKIDNSPSYNGTTSSSSFQYSFFGDCSESGQEDSAGDCNSSGCNGSRNGSYTNSDNDNPPMLMTDLTTDNEHPQSGDLISNVLGLSPGSYDTRHNYGALDLQLTSSQIAQSSQNTESSPWTPGPSSWEPSYINAESAKEYQNYLTMSPEELTSGLSTQEHRIIRKGLPEFFEPENNQEQLKESSPEYFEPNDNSLFDASKAFPAQKVEAHFKLIPVQYVLNSPTISQEYISRVLSEASDTQSVGEIHESSTTDHPSVEKEVLNPDIDEGSKADHPSVDNGVSNPDTEGSYQDFSIDLRLKNVLEEMPSDFFSGGKGRASRRQSTVRDDFSHLFEPLLLTVNTSFVEYKSDPWSLLLAEKAEKRLLRIKREAFEAENKIEEEMRMDSAPYRQETPRTNSGAHHEAEEHSGASPESTTDPSTGPDTDEHTSSPEFAMRDSSKTSLDHSPRSKVSLVEWQTPLRDLNTCIQISRNGSWCDEDIQNSRNGSWCDEDAATPRHPWANLESETVREVGGKESQPEKSAALIDTYESEKSAILTDASNTEDTQSDEEDYGTPLKGEESDIACEMVEFGQGSVKFAEKDIIFRYRSAGEYSETFPGRGVAQTSSARPKSSKMFTMSIRHKPYSPPKPSWYKASYDITSDDGMEPAVVTSKCAENFNSSKSAGGMPVSSIYLRLAKAPEANAEKPSNGDAKESGEKKKRPAPKGEENLEEIDTPFGNWKEKYAQKVQQNFVGCFDDIDDFIQEFNAKTVSIVETAAAAATAAPYIASGDCFATPGSHYSEVSARRSRRSTESNEMKLSHKTSGQNGEDEYYSSEGEDDEEEGSTYPMSDKEWGALAAVPTNRAKRNSPPKSSKSTVKMIATLDELVQEMETSLPSKFVAGKAEAAEVGTKSGHGGNKMKNMFHAVKSKVRRHFSHSVA